MGEHPVTVQIYCTGRPMRLHPKNTEKSLLVSKISSRFMERFTHRPVSKIRDARIIQKARPPSNSTRGPGNTEKGHDTSRPGKKEEVTLICHFNETRMRLAMA